MTTDDEYVWVTSSDADTIVRIDPTARAITGGLQGLGMPMDVVVLDGQVWVSGESLLRIDRDDVDVIDSVPAIAWSSQLAGGFGSLWAVADPEDQAAPPSSGAPSVPIDPEIIRIDPQRKDVAARIRIEGVCTTPDEWQSPSVIQLAVSDDAVWALTFCDGDPGYINVYQIDPTTDSSRLVTIVTGENDRGIGTHAMTIVDGTPWLATFDLNSEVPGRLVRIDADGGTFEGLGELGRWPAGITYAGGSLWVTDCADATLTQFDPSTGGVVGDPMMIGTPMPEDINEAEEFSCLGKSVVHGTTLWVCSSNEGTVMPVDIGA